MAFVGVLIVILFMFSLWLLGVGVCVLWPLHEVFYFIVRVCCIVFIVLFLLMVVLILMLLFVFTLDCVTVCI